MQRLGFIHEARACGFDIDEHWLREARHATFFDGGNFHPFDLVFVEAMFSREAGRDDFLRDLVSLSKELEKSWTEADKILQDKLREEDARRTKMRGEGADFPQLSDGERAAWRDLDLHGELPRAWQSLHVSPVVARNMYDDIRARIRNHDGYWKVRWIFYGSLDTNALQSLETNATGSMRYAHVLYRMGSLIGKYIAWKTGKAAPPLVTAPAGGVEWEQPRSLCPYCGGQMPDWGERPRKHCGATLCTRKYNRQRKGEQRNRIKVRSE